MKIRKASPLLLLLTPSLVCNASNINIPLQDHRLQRRDARDEAFAARRETESPVEPSTITTTRSSQQTSKPYRGTEDAPVDGLDGKPHAGPFVDTTPEEDGRDKDSTKPASLDRFASSGDERWRVEDIPERNDGVMNDEYRIAPKKGTTGTEGGISEKERLRKETGNADNRPYEPKVASPYREHVLRVEDDSERVYERSDKSTEESRKRSSEDYDTGLKHPEDLPDRPHDIPYPKPPQRREGEPPEGWEVPSLPNTEGKTNPRPRRTLSQIINSWIPASKPAHYDPDRDDEGWHEWVHSFVLSLTMILFSEIGDKTFLVAALMAMRHNQVLVFTAAFSALILMTVLSAVLGHAVPTLLPKRLTTFAAAMLFLVFGARMLREGLAMPHDLGVGEEMKEVEAELEEKEHSMALDRSRRRSSLSAHALESGRGRSHSTKFAQQGGQPSPPPSRSPSPSPPPKRGALSKLSGLMNLCSLILSPAWVQTFVMTFLGEWGDRSQIATIAMAAGQDYWWVTLGAILGHACCTGLAVIGGRALAGRVSMRVVTIGGAVAFLVFGVIYLFECMFE